MNQIKEANFFWRQQKIIAGKALVTGHGSCALAEDILLFFVALVEDICLLKTLYRD